MSLVPARAPSGCRRPRSRAARPAGRGIWSRRRGLPARTVRVRRCSADRRRPCRSSAAAAPPGTARRRCVPAIARTPIRRSIDERSRSADSARRAISVSECSLPSVKVSRIEVILLVTDRPASVEFPATAHSWRSSRRRRIATLRWSGSARTGGGDRETVCGRPGGAILQVGRRGRGLLGPLLTDRRSRKKTRAGRRAARVLLVQCTGAAVRWSCCAARHTVAAGRPIPKPLVPLNGTRLLPCQAGARCLTGPRCGLSPRPTRFRCPGAGTADPDIFPKGPTIGSLLTTRR